MAGNTKLRDIAQSDKIMSAFRWIFMGVGVLLFCIILFKVITHDSSDDAKYTATEIVRPVTPVRGNILDCKDRILATSTVCYSVFMDCAVQSDSLWDNNIMALSRALAAKFGNKSETEYLNMLQKERRKGNRYFRVLDDVSQSDIYAVRAMPIFKKGQNEGGYIEKVREKRLYPYGSSARRTIGYVKNNADNNSKRGVEGHYDKDLHGVDGVQVYRKSDFGFVPVDDSRNERSRNGKDIRTTIDVDIQNIADQALRKTVEKSELIEMACVVVMETRTGAIKAMVNLGRDAKTGAIGEWNNYALLMADPPGSVFKAAVLMAMLEDGYITSLEQEIPTYGGVWTYGKHTFHDEKHLSRKRFPTGYIKVREAFEMSANNPFRQMICDPGTYGSNPSRFINRIKSFGLIDTLEFDLKGASVPCIVDTSMKRGNPKGYWDGTTLPRMAIGYNMEVSPLNLVTFYNAIANDGKVMKPYLIDAIIDNGSVKEKFRPQVLHERICRKEVCDTLKKVMAMVTANKNGTAYWQLKDAVCPIAGKTGTAQRLFEGRNGKWTYNDGGRESQRGTFVGFFPVDNPTYTAVVVVWNRPSLQNFYGATYAAPVFREIADKIYCLNDDK